MFLCRWDFDDPEMDHLLNMTNDLVVGNAFLNVDVLLPDFIVKMFRSEVYTFIIYTLYNAN